ncbi:hypothetical protein F1C58_16275 (plasmid) [Glaciihabitans sp. INWT7]|uniref:hypothetical protein n=1 Tax=Glaciihabitans sp. INWT7 TaxID=2596912 RepID=UPI00162A1628|nr:hypothetical protein [Glaciihabitans sp. INWT7]QNE48616.1 hypothetical protein F1C58_16275 [Glaciihabitans sp. INWT7]
MQGQWLLVEREQHLLAAGDKTYTGVSLRRTLDPVGRAILMPELKSAAQRTTDTALEVSYDSRNWVVRTIPIIAPQSGEITAVLGIYVEAGDVLPGAPIVGSWEWEVSPPGPNQTMRSYWDDEMFEIYGIEPTGHSSGRGAWPTPQWFNEIIVPEDRARLRIMIDEGISAVTPELHTLIYSVVTGSGSSKPGRRKLRLSGRAHKDASADIVWLRGITHEISDHIDESTPGLTAALTDDFLRAAFELATDVALAAVDTRYWHVYMTSPGWEAAGLATITNGSISSLAERTDIAELEQFLLAAALSPEVAEKPLVVKLQTAPGAYKFYSVRASGLRSGSEKNRYVMMRVSPL